jgi:hypothetical protein
MPQSRANSGNIGEANRKMRSYVNASASTGSSFARNRPIAVLEIVSDPAACAREVAMFCKPIVVLAIALALGSSALSTSAFARDGRGAFGGRAFGGNHFGGCFDGGRMAGGCGDYGERVDGLHGGSDQGYGRSDVWGHWGGYYGPMVR